LNSWIQQLRKGLAEFFVLSVLEKEDLHGYAVLQVLSKLETMALTESAVYPLLARLRNGGYIACRSEKSASGPPRRIYTLTIEGKLRLRQMREYWAELGLDLKRIQGKQREKDGN